MFAAQLIFRQLFSVVARAMIPKKPRWSHNVWGAKARHMRTCRGWQVTRCCDSIFKWGSKKSFLDLFSSV